MGDPYRTPTPWVVRTHDWHDAEVGHLMDDGETFLDAAIVISDADAPLVAAAPDLYRELKAVEWVQPDQYNEPACPSCSGWEAEGHLPDCTLAAALRKAETDHE